MIPDYVRLLKEKQMAWMKFVNKLQVRPNGNIICDEISELFDKHRGENILDKIVATIIEISDTLKKDESMELAKSYIFISQIKRAEAEYYMPYRWAPEAMEARMEARMEAMRQLNEISVKQMGRSFEIFKNLERIRDQ